MPEPINEQLQTQYWGRLRRQKEEVLNVRADAVERRSPVEHVLARVAHTLAHPSFFVGELAFHITWVLLNSGWVPGVEPWDPYPFGFLGGFASMQALFIGLLILMHTQRSERIDELREETQLQVSLHAERETTKLIRMVLDVHRALGIRSPEQDEELGEMAEPLDPQQLRDQTERHLRETEDE